MGAPPQRLHLRPTSGLTFRSSRLLGRAPSGPSRDSPRRRASRWPADGSDVHMPGFAQTLTDQQVATLGSYLIKHYGNPAAVISADQVQILRAGGAPSHLVLLARLALVVIVLVFVTIMVMFIRRRRRKGHRAGHD